MKTTSDQVERGVAAAIATLQDRDTGAGSDLEEDIYPNGDGVFVEIHGSVDMPQLVREILDAAPEAQVAEAELDAAVIAFHAELSAQGLGWTKPSDWRDEIAAALNAAREARA